MFFVFFAFFVSICSAKLRDNGPKLPFPDQAVFFGAIRGTGMNATTTYKQVFDKTTQSTGYWAGPIGTGTFLMCIGGTVYAGRLCSRRNQQPLTKYFLNTQKDKCVSPSPARIVLTRFGTSTMNGQQTGKLLVRKILYCWMELPV